MLKYQLFNNWLLTERRKAELSQEALSEKSGVSPSEISRIENEPDRTIKLVTAEKLAQGFGKKLWMVLQELDV